MDFVVYLGNAGCRTRWWLPHTFLTPGQAQLVGWHRRGGGGCPPCSICGSREQTNSTLFGIRPAVQYYFVLLWRHWARRLRLTVVLFLLTAVTGILAVPLWSSCGHGGFGGWHGKLGFAAAFFVLLHIVQHRHWYSVKPGWR